MLGLIFDDCRKFLNKNKALSQGGARPEEKKSVLVLNF